jgi:hypothetical protein
VIRGSSRSVRSPHGDPGGIRAISRR